MGNQCTECWILGYSATHYTWIHPTVSQIHHLVPSTVTWSGLSARIFSRRLRNDYIAPQWTCSPHESIISFLNMCLDTRIQEQWRQMLSFATGSSRGAGFTHQLSCFPRSWGRFKQTKPQPWYWLPHWKAQHWFPSLLEILVDYPRQLPQQWWNNHAPFRTGDQKSTPAHTTPNSMVYIRQRFRAEGLSEAASNILLSSSSETTKKRYSGPWRAWSSWWAELSLCPFTAPMNRVLCCPSWRRTKAFRTIEPINRSFYCPLHLRHEPWISSAFT